MKDKKKKTDKQKRNKVMIAGLLSFVLAGISLGAGFYIGYMTLNYNYLTLGTIQNGSGIMTLFVCSGLMIALGVISVSVGIKLLSMAKSTNFGFYTKKSVVISTLIFYVIVAIVGIIAMVMSFSSMVASAYMFLTVILSILTIGLCVGCFILLIKEYKTFMNKIKNGEMTIAIEYPKRYIPVLDSSKAAAVYNNKTYHSDSMNIDAFQNELKRLDEMRGQGLINDQEYQQLKKHYIDKMSSKLF